MSVKLVRNMINNQKTIILTSYCKKNLLIYKKSQNLLLQRGFLSVCLYAHKRLSENVFLRNENYYYYLKLLVNYAFDMKINARGSR